MQLQEFLERSAQRSPSKTALICGEQRLTYQQIETQCNRFAHALIAIGVGRGDRVALYLDNSVEAVLSIFAIMKAGAIFTVINSATKFERLVHILNDSGAKVLITQGQKLATIQVCAAHMPHLQAIIATRQSIDGIRSGQGEVIWWDQLLVEHVARVDAPPKRNIDIDLAALIYTSGSTGNPKGVMMTHLNMVAAARSVSEYLENTADDIILNVLPLSSSYGLYQVLMAFQAGATIVLERSFTYPHPVLHRIMQERVTGLPIVPTVAAILLQIDLSAYHFPCLRYITNAGAALPAQHALSLRKLFPQTRLYLMYGLTECKRVSYLPPDELDRRPTSVGKAIPNVEAYVVDEEGRRLPPGEVGELVVRGANVMKGYWKLPEETARMLKPGPVPGEQVLYTGDLFRMDDEGYLYWIGRRDDIIKSCGEKVSPREVEDVLCSLEGVTMAAVIGVPDKVLGQAIKAVITVKEGSRFTKHDILRHCARHLEDFKIPTLVEFRETMPKTAAGKIDRRELARCSAGVSE